MNKFDTLKNKKIIWWVKRSNKWIIIITNKLLNE